MFDWIKTLLGRNSCRIAEPWETPQEIREKLWCIPRGIDPASIKNSKNGAVIPPILPDSTKDVGIHAIDGSEDIRESAD